MCHMTLHSRALHEHPHRLFTAAKLFAILVFMIKTNQQDFVHNTKTVGRKESWAYPINPFLAI